MTYTGPSIVDYLKSVGKPSDFSSRTQLAQQYGISGYGGTAEQNTQLLNILRVGQQAPPAPPSTPPPTPPPPPAQPTYVPPAYQQPTYVPPAYQPPAPPPSAPADTTATGTEPPEETWDEEDEETTLQKTFKDLYGIDLDANAFKFQPAKSFQEVYQDVFESMGLASVQTEIDKVAASLKAIDTELQDKIMEVNENPWLSEAARSRSVSNLQEKYQARRETEANILELYQGIYDQGRDDARFAAQQALNTFYKEQGFQQDQLEFLIERADKVMAAKAKLAELNPSEYKSVQGGLYNIKTNQWIIPPKETTKETTTDKILSPAEAKSLGVPYGTTKGEAIAMGAGTTTTVPTQESFVKVFQPFKDAGYPREDVERQYRSQNKIDEDESLPTVVTQALDAVFGVAPAKTNWLQKIGGFAKFLIQPWTGI